MLSYLPNLAEPNLSLAFRKGLVYLMILIKIVGHKTMGRDNRNKSNVYSEDHLSCA
jgi:hypothetical protein